jgi:MerR family transcriptional regulator, copper efflux regulator
MPLTRLTRRVLRLPRRRQTPSSLARLGSPDADAGFLLTLEWAPRRRLGPVKQPHPRAIRIGTLAEQCRLSRDTIRYYERLGLLPKPPRSAGGFREYPPETIRRIKVVQRSLSIGFTLAELSGVFAERAAGRAPCNLVRKLAGQKLVDLEATIARMQQLRGALAKTLAAWDVRLKQVAREAPARLLESLADLPDTEHIQPMRPPYRGGTTPSAGGQVLP